MLIETTYTLSEQEYVEAQMQYQRLTSPLFYRCVPFFPVFLLVVLLGTNPSGWRDFLTVKGFPVLLLVSFFLAIPRLQRRLIKKRYKVELTGLTDVLLRLDDFGYHAEKMDGSRGDVPWSVFTSYMQTSSLIAPIKGFAFYALPRSAFNSDQWIQIETTILSRLPLLTRKLFKQHKR